MFGTESQTFHPSLPRNSRADAQAVLPDPALSADTVFNRTRGACYRLARDGNSGWLFRPKLMQVQPLRSGVVHLLYQASPG